MDVAVVWGKWEGDEAVWHDVAVVALEWVAFAVASFGKLMVEAPFDERMLGSNRAFVEVARLWMWWIDTFASFGPIHRQLQSQHCEVCYYYSNVDDAADCRPSCVAWQETVVVGVMRMLQ